MQEDPIPALPERRYEHLMKSLKKYVPDTSKPLSANQTLNEDEIGSIFFKFSVKLLKNYRSACLVEAVADCARLACSHRDYLEAPSEFVVDKFDKSRFLNEHPDKCKFLQDFLETQMFQCFIDDRYDAKSKGEPSRSRAAVFTLC